MSAIANQDYVHHPHPPSTSRLVFQYHARPSIQSQRVSKVDRPGRGRGPNVDRVPQHSNGRQQGNTGNKVIPACHTSSHLNEILAACVAQGNYSTAQGNRHNQLPAIHRAAQIPQNMHA